MRSAQLQWRAPIGDNSVPNVVVGPDASSLPFTGFDPWPLVLPVPRSSGSGSCCSNWPGPWLDAAHSPRRPNRLPLVGCGARGLFRLPSAGKKHLERPDQRAPGDADHNAGDELIVPVRACRVRLVPLSSIGSRHTAALPQSWRSNDRTRSRRREWPLRSMCRCCRWAPAPRRCWPPLHRGRTGGLRNGTGESPNVIGGVRTPTNSALRLTLVPESEP